jgi:uncharacterized coiled-coil protein SlyX
VKKWVSYFNDSVLGFTVSMSENEEKEQHQQSSDFPTSGYEAAEEERYSLKGEEEEEHNTSVGGQNEEEQSPQESAATQRKRSGRGERRSDTTTIATAASAWQVTLIDLDKQLNKQSRLMERMSDDVRQLKKQFNQVQRDLLKFEKRMQKMKTTTRSSAKREKRRG